jgi:tRNA (mo5U34)-methyltransferase
VARSAFPMDGKRPDLRDEIIRLGPWRLRVQVTPELSTAAWLSEQPGTHPDSDEGVDFVDAREAWVSNVLRIFPNGLEGRSVLDCACGCGAFLFWAKELGAGDCLGLDSDQRSIEQARFLLENRGGPSDGIRFEVGDLHEIPRMALGRFDVTLFNDVFDRLPNPIGGLEIAAGLTDELIQVVTGTGLGRPDGLLLMRPESEDRANPALHGLHWLPSGPDVVAKTLAWSGFPATRVVRSLRVLPGLGRMELVASRAAELLETYSPPPPEISRTGLARRFFRALGAQAAVSAHILRDVCARDVELSTIDVEGAREVRGRDSVLRQLGEERSRYGRDEVGPELVVDTGDRVLAFARGSGRSSSGPGLDARTALLFTFRDDRVVRIERFDDRRRALEAAGIRE